MEKPGVSIIIPTLNEAENIDAIVSQALAAAEKFSPEIIVVDDGSRDGTREKTLELGKSRPVRLLARDGVRDGLAGAVLAGGRAALADVVVVMDADLSHPPERLPDLIQPVQDRAADMSIGSRYAPGGSTPGWPWVRRAMSRSASALAWPLTDCHDALSGFFCVRRKRLTEIPADAAGFKIALEVVVRGGDHLRIREIPITFRDRTYGQSKMGTRVIFTYFRRVLALSGWRESQGTVKAALFRTALIAGLDLALFEILTAFSQPWQEAHAMSFTVAWMMHFALKIRQRPPEQRTGLRFALRFLGLAIAAFALRHETFQVGLHLHLPAVLAILPALFVTATIGYIGYALLLWPRPGEYNRRTRRRLRLLGLLGFLAVLATLRGISALL